MAPARAAPAWEELFEPAGVIIAGASPHPGRFGTVALHNLLAAGYPGRVFATSREGGDVLGVATVVDVAAIPEGAADLVMVCTPAAINAQLLRDCGARGVRAAFVAAGGYAETGEAGERLEREIVAAAADWGMLLAGPNGQGVISTPAGLCAQIVAPYPPAGGIAIASQSGNLSSAFCNYAVASGVGVSRAVSAGNAAALGVVDYLEYFSEDDASSVSLAYIEGISDGRDFLARAKLLSARKPIVVLKGGASALGQRAAQSHTGSLATNDRLFDAACRQAGLVRAASASEAFEAAASFATQPLPAGPNVLVVTPAGGWGVLTADAIAGSELTLLPLPDDLRSAFDALLPPRWSGANPIDTAAGETRDTIAEILRLAVSHAEVHSVILLGGGIQSNQAALMREGPLFESQGLARIADYHERQDRRYAEVAASLSEESGKPILLASELAATQPGNASPAAVRASGRLAYASGPDAVRALNHLWQYARWRERRTEA
ncbi:MAG: acetyltransferase [Chloroflexi bacterium]|nr:MAG: acetyltransferase [Chloroflexota bacterium]